MENVVVEVVGRGGDFGEEKDEVESDGEYKESIADSPLGAEAGRKVREGPWDYSVSFAEGWRL